jgi:pSer/pThr/pTyr-binding forkhead associated (FHA) protein
MDASKSPALTLNSFVQLCFDESVVAEYEITAARLTIGRHSDCDIFIDNAAVSGLHAFLIQEQGKFYVKDAMSKNGVMVNGKKAELIELTQTQFVSISGKYSLKLVKSPTQNPNPKLNISTSEQPPPAETMMVSTSIMAQMGQRVRPAYLTMTKANGGSWILRLDKSEVTVGRSKDNDIRTGGWFAPSQLACIRRGDDGFYLESNDADSVTVNGERAKEQHYLKEGDRLKMGRAVGVFHERNGDR